eukprot:8592343-Lingulodinium_polyedra.AAC.1
MAIVRACHVGVVPRIPADRLEAVWSDCIVRAEVEANFDFFVKYNKKRSAQVDVACMLDHAKL